MAEKSDPPPTGGRGGLRVVGLLLALVAVGFCVYALVRDWDEVADSFRVADRPELGVATVLSAASMAWLAVLWHRCLAALGSPAPLGEVVTWYFVGELGKYVPGGVWQVIGRSELAHRSRGIRRSVSYASTLLAYAVMCGGAVMVCALMSPLLATGEDGVWWAWLLAPALVVIPVAVHPAVTGVALRTITKVARRDLGLSPLPWSTMLALLAWSVPAWVLLGSATSVTVAALDLDAGSTRVAVAAVAAWVIGFLAVPVPAGAGVREVTFASLSGLTAGPAVAVAVLARVLLVLVDAVCGVVALLVQRRRDASAERP